MWLQAALASMDSGPVFFSSRRRHTRFDCDWSSDVCSSDLSCDDGERFSGIALCKCLTNAQHRMKTRADRSREFFARLLVGLAEYVPALGVTDQRGTRTRLRGQGTGDRACVRPFGFPIDVLGAGQQIGALRDDGGDSLE